MSTALVVRCHACKARIKAPLQLLGQVRPCPRCQQPIRIRVQPPEDAGPVVLGNPQFVDTKEMPALSR